MTKSRAPHSGGEEVSSLAPALTTLQELQRGWRPLLACSVGIGLGLSPIPPFTAGLFATALEQEFNWPRGEILGSIIFVTIALVVFGAAIGRLVDRVGARKVALLSTMGLGLSLASLALITSNIMTFYAGWAVMAVVAVGTLPITYARVITGWFDRARGLALGISLASTGVTGALVPYYVQWVMDGYGWRIAYLALAALPLLIALPVIWIFLREPERISTAADKLQLAGLAVGQAVRDYRFWALSIAAVGLGTGTGGLIPNLVPLLVERGADMAYALHCMAILAISIVVGRLITGFMLDRMSGSLVGLLLILPVLVGLAVLGQASPTEAMFLFSAMTIGLIAGAEFDLVAYLTSRYFGRKHFSELYGIQYAIFGLGSGAAPAAYGAVHDLTGSYNLALIISGSCFAVSALCLLTMGRYPASFDIASPAQPQKTAEEATAA